MKEYTGVVPPCGVFCGGCPNYIRDRKPCPGAEKSQRCASKGCPYYVCCCTEKGHEHCHQCAEYPCKRFKRFARNWIKYGQDFIENQKLLKAQGKDAFLERWNTQARQSDCNEGA